MLIGFIKLRLPVAPYGNLFLGFCSGITKMGKRRRKPVIIRKSKS